MRKCEFCDCPVSDNTLTNCPHCGAPLPMPQRIRIQSTPAEQKATEEATTQLVGSRLAKTGFIMSCASLGVMLTDFFISASAGEFPVFFAGMSAMGLLPVTVAVVGMILCIIASKKEHGEKKFHTAGIVISAVTIGIYLILLCGCAATFGELADYSVLD